MKKETKGNIFFYTTLFLSFFSSLVFCLPEVAPRDFHKGDPLYVKVNKLTSTKTQLPYDYYYLNYCKPSSNILNNAENLGEVLRGDRIENSVYTFKMLEDQPCKVACRVKLDAESTKKLKEKIHDEFRANLVLDNLPVAELIQSIDGTHSTNVQGFRVGLIGSYAGMEEYKYFIYNHLSFRVMYHGEQESDSSRIVGFEVTPYSIMHEYKEWDENNNQLTACNNDTENLIQSSHGPQEVEEGKEIVFTYDVSFKESEIKWASRWDTYLVMNEDQIHWFSIINSLMIVLFLFGMAVMIIMRTLYKNGGVFMPPVNSGLLCVTK
ncbi:unnamed protein product [Eruca vesicaria subsp. sativa]|uniref:Transmembrane 9 superfamily member n=1 Tax=Eruca vesicaria subsp. sativa TaxID=29727 RepID=A0ABC8K8E3_ERUVS|nr:unnamed protein product [Eruca vesicaria subsp. sativa]